VSTATHYFYRDFSILALGVRPTNRPSRKMACTTWIHSRMSPLQ